MTENCRQILTQAGRHLTLITWYFVGMPSSSVNVACQNAVWRNSAEWLPRWCDQKWKSRGGTCLLLLCLPMRVLDYWRMQVVVFLPCTSAEGKMTKASAVQHLEQFDPKVRRGHASITFAISGTYPGEPDRIFAPTTCDDKMYCRWGIFGTTHRDKREVLCPRILPRHGSKLVGSILKFYVIDCFWSWLLFLSTYNVVLYEAEALFWAIGRSLPHTPRKATFIDFYHLLHHTDRFSHSFWYDILWKNLFKISVRAWCTTQKTQTFAFAFGALKILAHPKIGKSDCEKSNRRWVANNESLHRKKIPFDTLGMFIIMYYTFWPNHVTLQWFLWHCITVTTAKI